MALTFGAHENPLDKRGRADCARLRLLLGNAVVAPDRAAAETIAEIGADAVVDDALAAIDLGRWKSLTPDQVDPMELGLWFSDLCASPHGGESIAAFVARLNRWLDACPEADICAVIAPGTAQGLISAATGADFWNIEVAPAAMIDLERRGGRWLLRLT